MYGAEADINTMKALLTQENYESSTMQLKMVAQPCCWLLQFFTFLRLVVWKSRNINSRRVWKLSLNLNIDKLSGTPTSLFIYTQRRSTKRFGRPLIR